MSLLAFPDGDLEYLRTGEVDMMMMAAKMAIIPPRDTPPEAIQLFCDLLSDYIIRHHGKWPVKYFVQQFATSAWGDFDTVCPPIKRYKL